MRLEADFDKSGTVTSAFYETLDQSLGLKLKPGHVIEYDFGSQPALDRLEKMPRENARSHVVCFVVKYRRAVDSKPKLRLIIFEAVRVSPSANWAYALPIGISSYLSYYPNTTLMPGVVKKGLMQFLEQLDVVSPLDE